MLKKINKRNISNLRFFLVQCSDRLNIESWQLFTICVSQIININSYFKHFEESIQANYCLGYSKPYVSDKLSKEIEIVSTLRNLYMQNIVLAALNDMSAKSPKEIEILGAQRNPYMKKSPKGKFSILKPETHRTHRYNRRHREYLHRHVIDNRFQSPRPLQEVVNLGLCSPVANVPA